LFKEFVELKHFKLGKEEGIMSKRTMVVSVCGLSLLGLAAWGSFNYLQSQEKPKPKEKQEVIETRGEAGKKEKYESKDEKNDPKATKVTKRAGAFTCDVRTLTVCIRAGSAAREI
jgi:hypothetical protein